MTTFDRRKDAFENKFARDADLRFKATSRRNRLLGLWAAEKLGKSGDEADTYAREVIRSDMQEAGDDDVLRKIREDFKSAGIDQSDSQIRHAMDELMAKAVAQIEASS